MKIDMKKHRKKIVLAAGAAIVAGGAAWVFYPGRVPLEIRCGRNYISSVKQKNGGAEMTENMYLMPLGFDDMFDWRPSIIEREFADPFVRMHRHMSRMLAAMDGEFATMGRRLPSRAMRMDVFVKDGAFKVVADLPGLAKGDIEVSVHDGFLSVKGEKKSSGKDSGKTEGYYLNERSSVSFSRTISLPDGVDADKAEVEFKDGVLSISMPVKELPRPEVKKLSIK